MKVFKSMTPTLAAGIITLILGPVVTADTAPAAQPNQAQASAIRSSCRSDYRSHCASVPTGGPEALQCLQKNVASLSPACQKAVNAVATGAPAAPAASPVSSAPAAAAPAASRPPTGSCNLRYSDASVSCGTFSARCAGKGRDHSAGRSRCACEERRREEWRSA
jgi:Cysteine rich repeat